MFFSAAATEFSTRCCGELHQGALLATRGKLAPASAQYTVQANRVLYTSVKRLENLFDKLYSDTFSMMKDTVSDMRKHIWSGGESDVPDSRDAILEEADKKAEAKVAEMKQAVDDQLSEIFARQRLSEGNLSEVRSEMKSLLERTIQKSRQIDSEAREETVRDHILTQVRRARIKGRVLNAMELTEALMETVPTHRVLMELDAMKRDGLISYEGEHLSPATTIRLPTRKELGERSGGLSTPTSLE